MFSFVGALAALPLISGLALSPNHADNNIPMGMKAPLVKRAQVCGSKGYTTGTDSYYYKSDPGQATVSACGMHCFADKKCLSFAVGAGTCQTFQVAV